MKKTIIHRVEVHEPSAKVHFQIRLPRNAKSIEDIAIHCPGNPGTNGSPEIGSVWLSIPERRDAFFCDIVRHHFAESDIASYAPIPQVSPVDTAAYWTEGKKYKPFTAFVCGSVTLIEGFYMDQVGRFLTDAYTVNIYLNLEI